MDKAADAEVISVFIYSKLDRNLISKLPHTHFIATRSTGFEHIDLQTCRERSITVFKRARLWRSHRRAEHTFALILSLSRGIHQSYQRTQRGEFTCGAVQGFDLNGKVLGVLGTGHIGINVIEIARGFKMKVLAYDKFPKTGFSSSLGFQYVPCQSLLEQSDIVTLHLPLYPRNLPLPKQRHHRQNEEKRRYRN